MYREIVLYPISEFSVKAFQVKITEEVVDKPPRLEGAVIGFVYARIESGFGSEIIDQPAVFIALTLAFMRLPAVYPRLLIKSAIEISQESAAITLIKEASHRVGYST